MKLKNGQILVGRIISDTSEKELHKKLREQIKSIIERARDSTLMDDEYDVRIIENLFIGEKISVKLPPNEWAGRKNPNDVIKDREFMLSLYITRVKAWLEFQGIEVKE